jgi:hypothetical protein
MRRRRWWFVIGGCVVFSSAIAALLTASSRDVATKFQITVLNQRIVGDSLIVSVMASNAGPAVLVNGGNFDVRYQVNGVWSTNSLPGMRSSIAWLLPGQTSSQRLRLPLGVSRFQVGAAWEVAHGRVAAFCRLYSSPLPHWISAALANVLSLLPYRPGPYVEFWDAEHDFRAVAN